MNFVKEIFSDDFKKVKTPEILSIIMILLIIFKFTSFERYNLLINSIFEELGGVIILS